MQFPHSCSQLQCTANGAWCVETHPGVMLVAKNRLATLHQLVSLQFFLYRAGRVQTVPPESDHSLRLKEECNAKKRRGCAKTYMIDCTFSIWNTAPSV